MQNQTIETLHEACAHADLAVEKSARGANVAVCCLTGERIGGASRTWTWLRDHPERLRGVHVIGLSSI